MNILFLSSTFPRFKGDSQAPFVLEQATAWKVARPNDHISVLAPHDQGIAEHEVIDGIRVHRFRYAWPVQWQKLAYPAILPNIRRRPILALLVPLFLLAEIWATFKTVRRYRIDLVYAHWVFPQGLAALLTHLIKGTPFVLQNHSSDLSVLLKLPVVGARIARLMIRRCIAFCCVNHHQYQQMISLFRSEEVPEIESKTLVRPMGVGSLPSTSALDCDNMYEFATMSRLTRKKGIEHFIQAIRIANTSGAFARIAIAGNGELEDELKALVQDANIDFLGFLSGEDKVRFMNQVRCFVVASIDAQGDVEGLPVSILEPLALGRLLITTYATNITTLPEWNELKDLVLIVENPENHEEFATVLKRAMSLPDSELKRICGSAARITNRYRWNNLIQEYLEFVEQRYHSRANS
ncbi:MAG: glycosyltransferase [Pseudomonadota bacterium]